MSSSASIKSLRHHHFGEKIIMGQWDILKNQDFLQQFQPVPLSRFVNCDYDPSLHVLVIVDDGRGC
eukprot:scaffold23471_cov141-Cylindrotheca_fusiformis.AAC.6